MRVGREQDEADPRDALAGHRMRAELVIETLMRAFAEQIEIEVAQDRRKAVRVLELDGVVAEARAQPVMARVRRGFRRRTARPCGCVRAARRCRRPRRPRRRTHPAGMRARRCARFPGGGRGNGTGRNGGHAGSHRLRSEALLMPARLPATHATRRSARPAASPAGAPVRIRFRRTPSRAGRSGSRLSAAAGSAGHSRSSVIAAR